MTVPEPSWAEGLAILRDRHARLPSAIIEAFAASLPTIASAAEIKHSRAIVTTGVGSSLAHARYLSWLLRTRANIPSWDVPTATYLTAPGPEAREQALVVFSQGLSPNARFPLAYADRYRTTVLVTAADSDSKDRADAVKRARDLGAIVVPMPCAPEYEVLLRFTGPLVGYAVALRLANAAGSAIDFDPKVIAMAITDASARMTATLAGIAPRAFADPVTFVATGGYAPNTYNLAAKVLEGMFLPWPLAVDALELAHGGIQEATEKPRTFIALGRNTPHDQHLFARVSAVLAPQHRLIEANAHLPEPLEIFEHEAMMNVMTLASIAARRVDQKAWPGKGRDGPLYGVGQPSDLHAPPPIPHPLPNRLQSHRLEDLTWPEIEARIAAGDRTVVIPLGATEQHGPHMSLAVDSIVAGALAERFCLRAPHALQAPVITIGCSPEHLAFPGTLSLSPSTLKSVLIDLLRSLANHGFSRAVLFSAHGGNDTTLAESERELRAHATPMKLTVVHGIDHLGKIWQEASERAGAPAGASGHHAGEFETSIIAALRPDAIRWAEVRAGISGEVSDPQTLFYPNLRAHAPTGVVGDPSFASAERAARYLDAWVDVLLRAYEEDGGAP